MYIIGDIGNTETKICVFNSKKKLVIRKLYNTNSLRSHNIKNKLIFLKKFKTKIKKTIFSSVVPKVYKNIKKTIEKIIDLRVKELKQYNLKKIIKIKADLKQVGSDRIANAISVIDDKKDYIILDFGTATTFDVILKNSYRGGIIAPGVKLSLNTLFEKASLIPNIKLTKVSKVIGKNTKSAVRAGFYWGYKGLIKNIIYKIEKESKRSFTLILTGGLSHLFKDTIKKKSKIDKDLTIKGLLKLTTI